MFYVDSVFRTPYGQSFTGEVSLIPIDSGSYIDHWYGWNLGGNERFISRYLFFRYKIGNVILERQKTIVNGAAWFAGGGYYLFFQTGAYRDDAAPSGYIITQGNVGQTPVAWNDEDENAEESEDSEPEESDPEGPEPEEPPKNKGDGWWEVGQSLPSRASPSIVPVPKGSASAPLLLELDTSVLFYKPTSTPNNVFGEYTNMDDESKKWNIGSPSWTVTGGASGTWIRSVQNDSTGARTYGEMKRQPPFGGGSYAGKWTVGTAGSPSGWWQSDAAPKVRQSHTLAFTLPAGVELPEGETPPPDITMTWAGFVEKTEPRIINYCNLARWI